MVLMGWGVVELIFSCRRPPWWRSPRGAGRWFVRHVYHLEPLHVGTASAAGWVTWRNVPDVLPSYLLDRLHRQVIVLRLWGAGGGVLSMSAGCRRGSVHLGEVCVSSLRRGRRKEKH